jgi:hypothetical protein
LRVIAANITAASPNSSQTGPADGFLPGKVCAADGMAKRRSALAKP